MPFLVLDQVSKIYRGPVHALRGLTLHVERHECVVLLGPSGCGKTTTLRLIAGLEQPTSGEIFLADQKVTEVPPWKRDVDFLFQRPTLLPEKTVRHNVTLDMRITPEEADTLSEVFGIKELMGRMPMELSGGERQRVALVRTLARGRRLQLMDEPLAHLDVPVKRRLWQELALLHRRFPTTIIYVTHDPAEAIALADRIAVVLDGKIQQVDVPLLLRSRPAHRFVAEVLQDPDDPLNFMDDRLDEDRSFQLDAPSGDAIAAIPASQFGLEEWKADCTGIPWIVTLKQQGLTSRLVVCEKNGMRMLVRVAPDWDVQPGQKVMIQRIGNRVHWFRRASGQRVEAG